MILLALVFAAYAPSQRAELVNWDDPVHVYENPRVTAPDALQRAWTDGTKPGFYPVLYGIYRLEWLAGGGKPWLFHVDNVLLHAVNMLLVGLLARAARDGTGQGARYGFPDS